MNYRENITGDLTHPLSPPMERCPFYLQHYRVEWQWTFALGTSRNGSYI